jgi:hypothetical protein
MMEADHHHAGAGGQHNEGTASDEGAPTAPLLDAPPSLTITTVTKGQGHPFVAS